MQDTSVTFASLRILYYRYKETAYYPLTVAIVVILVSVLLFIQLVIPQISSWFSLQEEIRTTRQRIKTMIDNDQFLISRGDAQISGQFDITTEALPFEKDFSGIYNAIIATSSQVGVVLSDFGFSIGDLSEQAAGGLASIQVNLAITASPNQVKKFIDSLSRSVPLSEVTTWTNSENTANISIKFYYRALPQIPIDTSIPLQSLSSEELATLQSLRSWKPVVVENTAPESVATDSATSFPAPL